VVGVEPAIAVDVGVLVLPPLLLQAVMLSTMSSSKPALREMRFAWNQRSVFIGSPN
jgi:hypothetical protein